MKKILKLGVVASMVCCSTVYADTLEEAFKNSKVKGEIKAQYFNKQMPYDGKDDSIFVVGGNLNLVTGSFYGLQGGVTFQTSHVVDIDTEGDNDYKGTMDASGAVMSESYLQYTLGNTSAKVGRQYISTSLVAGSGSRMIKQSFEGVTLVNKDIPNTTLTAGYVYNYQNRTDGKGNPGEFENFEDGAWTILAQNNSVENLTLKAQYLDVKGEAAGTDKDALYLEGGYDFGVANVAAQYLDTSNGDDDGKLYGLKASTKVGMVNLTGLYTTTSDDDTVYSGVGSGADPSFTALPLHGGGVTYKANTDTLVGIVGTNIAGVTAVGYYGVVDSKDDNNLGNADEVKAYGGFLQYAFTKNFSGKIMYESASFDGDKNTLKHDSDFFRIYTSYKF